MAIVLKHAKVSTKLDGVDTTAVLPSDWNAQHTFTAAAGKVLGTVVGSTTVSELPIEVDSTGQSVKPPSGTTAQRPASPSAGMMRYNTTTGLVEAYMGAAWGALESFPSGTKLLFQQTAAPTGWTKDTTHNDKALRVVSGAASSGGTTAFSTAFANRTSSSTTAGGTVGSTTLDITQIPSHQHYIANTDNANPGSNPLGANFMTRAGNPGTNNDYTLAGTATGATLGLTSAAGSNGGHSHSFTGTGHTHTLDMTVQYVDVIIATKN